MDRVKHIEFLNGGTSGLARGLGDILNALGYKTREAIAAMSCSSQTTTGTSEKTGLIVVTILIWCMSALVWKIVYNLFLSPLRSIPGPFLAKVTTKYLTINEGMGRRSALVEELHQKYGPVIRIAPDELSFSDKECVKELYLTASKFPKSRRYEGFSASTRASFDMTDKVQHRERRNLVRHVLAQSNIDEAEPLISSQVRKALPWVKSSEAGSLEIMLWMRRVMMDTAGGLFLGRSFNALDNEEPPRFLDDMDDYFNITALRWFAPWILKVMKVAPFRSIQHFLGAQKRSFDYGRKCFDEYIQQHGRFSGRIDLLTKMVGDQDSRPMTDEEISNELASLLVGATDTTVVVSTWMLWELAKRPEWQQRIREELHTHEVAFPGGVPAYKDIKLLPVLDGFVMESMRMHPAQSIGLPRIACTDTASIGGFVLPKGTYASVPSRQVHADPTVYPSPHDFLPERWIDTNGGTKEMKDCLLIFSKGSRACLGQYVATMELKLVVASLVNQWNASVAPETTDRVMQQTDYFLAFPSERKCWLQFRPVDQEIKNEVSE